MGIPIDIMRYHILPMRKEIIIYDYMKKYRDERKKMNEEYRWGKHNLKYLINTFNLSYGMKYDIFIQEMGVGKIKKILW
jgi:hypothetical protein